MRTLTPVGEGCQGEIKRNIGGNEAARAGIEQNGPAALRPRYHRVAGWGDRQGAVRMTMADLRGSKAGRAGAGSRDTGRGQPANQGEKNLALV